MVDLADVLDDLYSLSTKTYIWTRCGEFPMLGMACCNISDIGFPDALFQLELPYVF